MLSKSKIQWINSLKIKKNRNSENLFIVEGEKIVAEVLQSDWDVKSVFAVDSWENLNKNKTFDFYSVTEEELNKISLLTTPNKVVAVVRMKQAILNYEKVPDKNIFVYDDIQDPGNFGTIIRTLDWFGVDTIICSNESVDIYNPKVIQATMGSFLRVKVYYANIKEAIKELRKTGFGVYCTTMEGTDIRSIEIAKPSLIIFGNESKGIDDKILAEADFKISIPRSDKSRLYPESLNVAISTGIICSRISL